MNKCVVLEMEDKINFETKLNELLNCGYKIESSSCNSKCYKAILVLNVNESDIFPTANDAKKLVEENITNFNTPEIKMIKEEILNAITNCKRKAELNYYIVPDIEKTTYDFLKTYKYSFKFEYRERLFSCWHNQSPKNDKWLIISW